MIEKCAENYGILCTQMNLIDKCRYEFSSSKCYIVTGSVICVRHEKCIDKGKVHPRTRHKDPEGE
jgi:hypothetical protein